MLAKLNTFALLGIEAVPVESALVPVWLLILAALAGAATGVGLAGGGAVGEELWQRFFEEKSGSVPIASADRQPGEEL